MTIRSSVSHEYICDRCKHLSKTGSGFEKVAFPYNPNADRDYSYESNKSYDLCNICVSDLKSFLVSK